MIIRTQAIVLRRVEFSESSLVLSLLTPDYGRVSVMAKGARRLARSRIEGPLDLLSLCEVIYYEKPHASLHLLAESDLIEAFVEVRRPLSNQRLEVVAVSL